MGRGRKPKAALYARVAGRAERGVVHLTANVQLSRLAKLAKDRGWHVAGEFLDKPGDGTAGLELAVREIRPGGVLAVHDLARLGTATQAACWERVLLDQGSRLVLVQADPGPDPTARQTLVVYDDFRGRVKSRADGVRKGRPPSERGTDQFGSRPGEDEVIQIVHRLKAENHGRQEIADTLAELGYEARSPDGWTVHTVSNILRRTTPKK